MAVSNEKTHQKNHRKASTMRKKCNFLENFVISPLRFDDFYII